MSSHAWLGVAWVCACKPYSHKSRPARVPVFAQATNTPRPCGLIICSKFPLVGSVIAERYLHQSIFKPILGALALLASVFVCFATADLLDDAVATFTSSASLPKLLLVQTIIASEVLLPSALYFGVVDGLGRMYRNSELVVFYASGWSEVRAAAAVCKVLVPMAILVGVLSILVRPMAYEISYELEAESVQGIEPQNLVPGRFYPLGDSNLTLSIGGLDGEVMRDVFVQGEANDGSRVIRADEGRLVELPNPDDGGVGERHIELTDGYAYRLGQGTDHEYTYERLYLRLQPPAASGDVRNRRAKSTEVLLASDDPKEIAELQWRLALPMTSLLLGLLAVPLARNAPRQSRFRQMLVAILAYAVVFNLAIIAKGWVESGFVGAFPGLWWVHGVMLFALIVLFRRPGPG